MTLVTATTSRFPADPRCRPRLPSADKPAARPSATPFFRSLLRPGSGRAAPSSRSDPGAERCRLPAPPGAPPGSGPRRRAQRGSAAATAPPAAAPGRPAPAHRAPAPRRSRGAPAGLGGDGSRSAGRPAGSRGRLLSVRRRRPPAGPGAVSGAAVRGRAAAPPLVYERAEGRPGTALRRRCPQSGAAGARGSGAAPAERASRGSVPAGHLGAIGGPAAGSGRLSPRRGAGAERALKRSPSRMPAPLGAGGGGRRRKRRRLPPPRPRSRLPADVALLWLRPSRSPGPLSPSPPPVSPELAAGPAPGSGGGAAAASLRSSSALGAPGGGGEGRREGGGSGGRCGAQAAARLRCVSPQPQDLGLRGRGGREEEEGARPTCAAPNEEARAGSRGGVKPITAQWGKGRGRTRSGASRRQEASRDSGSERGRASCCRRRRRLTRGLARSRSRAGRRPAGVDGAVGPGAGG